MIATKAIATIPGQDTIHQELTTEEVTARDLEEQAWLDEQPDRNLLDQILTLEGQQTPRRIREAALGIDAGWLTDIEDQIVVLRAQLSGA